MGFRDYCFLSEIMSEQGLNCSHYDLKQLLESGSWPSVKKGILAGVAAAGLMAPFAHAADKPSPAVSHAEPIVGQDSPPPEPTDRTRARYERLKDKGIYYSVPTIQTLADMAEKGDEWAMREIAWPKDHKFHKKGRPFFRNKGPHPAGLKFDSGFKGD